MEEDAAFSMVIEVMSWNVLATDGPRLTHGSETTKQLENVTMIENI